jgi:adenylate kinase family enzyme
MSTDIPRRIHFTGGPGCGKSYLAQRLALILAVDYIDLDGRMLQLKPLDIELGTQAEHDAFIAARDDDLELATRAEAWVSDGAFIGVSKVAFERADLVVWMDAPGRVALFRIVARHVKAELRRDNRFPGWRRLGLFWRWSARFYTNRNPHGLNVWGTPNTHAFTREVVAPYESKLVVMRTKREVEALLRRLGLIPDGDESLIDRIEEYKRRQSR